MPLLALTRRRALVVAAVGLAVLAVGGRVLAGAGGPDPPPQAAAITPVAAAAPARLVVHVVGAVRRPGLYRLPEGSRVADAVARAGGPAAAANLQGINLAAPLADGLQVVVPVRETRAAGTAGTAPAARAGPVSLSGATAAELDALPGIGPVTAQRIVDYRTAHGGFRSVEELDSVPGIGPARVEQLKKLVTP